MTTLAPPAPHPASARTTAPEVPVACAHCALPVPPGLVDPDADQQFCCAGCAGVYRMIHGCGLDRYYELREATPGGSAQPAPDAGEARDGFALFDDPAFLDAHTQRRADGLRYADLRLANLHCAACVWLIERLPRVCPGVVEARLRLSQAVVRVVWEPEGATLSRIASALQGLGYPPQPVGLADTQDLGRQAERKMLARIGVAGACAGNVMLLATALYLGLLDGIAREIETYMRWISLLIGAVALLGPGGLFFRGAWAGVKTRRVTLDLPIALALGVGGLAGGVNVVLGRGEIYFDSLCVLVFLLLVGRYLQMRQQRRMTDAVTLMQSLTAFGCPVWRDGRWTELPWEAMEVGDRIRVTSNQRLAVDGQVVAGASSVDTSALTGESIPVSVTPGDAVHAGSLNVGGGFELLVTATQHHTRLARLMEEAAAGVAAKPQIVKLADRIAGVFTLVVVLLAGGVLAGWWIAAGPEPAIQHAAALLIVACPCALGLATPLTLAMAIGVAARRDILVKDAAVFEKLAGVRAGRPGVLALDKTGTVTTGQLEVVAWVGDPAYQNAVGDLERDARHPVGRALHQAYGSDGPSVYTQVIEDRQGGISARHREHTLVVGNARFLASRSIEIGSAWEADAEPYIRAGVALVWVAENDLVVAFAAVRDTLRPDSPGVVNDLAPRGWRPAMLSGDVERVVTDVAERLDVPAPDTHADLTPEDKLQRVHDYRDTGRPVFMVGDGVNDAAALAAADVGLAVQGGAEAAVTVADACTHRPGLAPVRELIELSRFTVRLIRQNLLVSLSYNLVAVGLAAAGLITPWIAAILMPISSLTVLSLAVSRLGRWKGGAPCPSST